MDRSRILAEIALFVSTNGGGVPTRESFERETGIRKYEWFPHLWQRWSDLLVEAGFCPNKPVATMDDEGIVNKYIELVRELGRLPIDDEIRQNARDDLSFPSRDTFAQLGGKRGLVAKVLEYCEKNPGFDDVATICERLPLRDDRADGLARMPQGHVYIRRSNRGYQIAFTARSRRHPEARPPDSTDLVHSIETDDPKGIDAYWHSRFASKRIGDTEFFNLDANDVAAFQRRTFQ